MVQAGQIFEIGNKPKDWRIDEPKNEDEYKSFVLVMDLDIRAARWILYSNAKIIFNRRKDSKLLDISCLPCTNYIDVNDNYLEFYFPLSPEIYTEIESIRNGSELEVFLSIEEMFLLPYIMNERPERISAQSMTQLFPDGYRPNQNIYSMIIKYDTAKCADCKLVIFRDDWVEKVIQPLGMGERFIVEIPCKFPEVPEGTYDEKILQVKDYLEDGIKSLRDCIDEYNKIKDHEKCAMKLRKEPTEILHRLPHDHTGTGKNFQYVKAYKEFLIEKSGAGTDNISKEMIDEMFKIIDTIYSISSKIGAHSFNKDLERFDYAPETEDAQMLLGITSLIYYWMGKKFERAAIKQIAESEAEEETEDA